MRLDLVILLHLTWLKFRNERRAKPSTVSRILLMLPYAVQSNPEYFSTFMSSVGPVSELVIQQLYPVIHLCSQLIMDLSRGAWVIELTDEDPIITCSFAPSFRCVSTWRYAFLSST